MYFARTRITYGNKTYSKGDQVYESDGSIMLGHLIRQGLVREVGDQDSKPKKTAKKVSTKPGRPAVNKSA